MGIIRTIIVDDEPRIRRGIERLIQDCDGEWEIVAVLSNGLQAKTFMEQINGNFDLLVTDVKMPEMDGVSLLKSMKSQYEFYTIFISGYDDFSYVQSAIREGASDYILKPIDREQFRQRMENIRASIEQNRIAHYKINEMNRQKVELVERKQTQLLSYVTSIGLDISRLGYWVNDFPSGHYYLLYISLDALPNKAKQFTEADWSAFQYAIDNMIGEISLEKWKPSLSHRWYWNAGNTDFWVLLNSSGATDAIDISTIALDMSLLIRSVIATHTPFTVSVAISSRVDDLYLLPKVLISTRMLIHNRLLYGGNQTFHMLEQNESEVEPTAQLNHRKLDRELLVAIQHIRGTVERRQQKECTIQLATLFSKLDQINSVEVIRNTIELIHLQLKSVLLEYEPRSEHNLVIDKYKKQLDKCDQRSELKYILNEYTQHMITIIDELRKTENSSVMESAIKYIEQHIFAELTVSKIAESVHLNPSYFSRYFKLHMGVTVLDFITESRMKAASFMLQNTMSKVQDICEKVGYFDVKHFTKQFKNYYQETPSAHRERHKIRDKLKG